jgi:hypothetical protein
VYQINANALPLMSKGACIIGDGTHKTYVVFGASYNGTMFGWGGSWMASVYSGTTLDPAQDKAGPVLRDLSIVGSTGSSNTQDAIELYDRNDFADIGPVDVFFVHGQCLGIGKLSADTIGYTRESGFRDIHCFHTGTASTPAVLVSSTSASGSDATNELKFYRLQVFDSPGVGLSITNPNNFNATRLIEFFAPRVEQSAADNIQVGSSSDAGGVNSIHFFGLESITPGAGNSGFYGLNLDTAGVQMYGIMVYGAYIGPCGAGTCKGINIGNVRLSQLNVTDISASGTDVTYTTSVGTNVILNGGNNEQNWTYSYGSGVHKKVVTPVYLYGDRTSASSNQTSITTGYHDSSATFGNAQGAGAMDLQSCRSGASQVASGAQAGLFAGCFNTASGSLSAIAGGTTNTVSGSGGFIGGGAQAIDRGRNSSQAFSGGRFSANGDAQAAHFVLSATCASCSSQQLTSGHAAVSSTNIANISAGLSYAMSWTCIARDVTSAGTDMATTMPVLLMTQETNAAGTAVVAGTAANVSRGTWTGGGFAWSADTTNGGLKIAFTSPTGNTDTFHAVCEGHDAETQ